jgi:hypothetical protein
MVVATYVIAPIPNWLCGRAANRDDFMESTGNGVVDFGRFLTGFLVVMGIGKSKHAGKKGRFGSEKTMERRHRGQRTSNTEC